MRRLVYQGSSVWEPEIPVLGAYVIPAEPWWWAPVWMWRALGAAVLVAGLLALADR